MEESGTANLIAPENFAMVEEGIYRSSFPRAKNMSFLQKLKLKTVLPLIPEDYPQNMKEFYAENNISLFQCGLDGNKWPFKELQAADVYKILAFALDVRNQPILIHCNKGKHRTGSIIGCLRKIRGWALSSTFHEYLMFANPRSRFEDQIFIESFSIEEFNLAKNESQKLKFDYESAECIPTDLDFNGGQSS